MLTKPVLLALLAACGVNSSTATAEPPSEQPDRAPPDEGEKDYIFCCQDVDTAKETGEGCITIGEKQIDSCSTVLACETFTKKDGKVTCT